MVPATAVPTFVFGRSNCGWLKMLKNSERHCSLTRSVIGNSLKIEKSKLVRPGERRMPRPALPKVYSAGVVQGAPGVSRAVLNHCVRFGFGKLASPTRLGRLPVPVLATGLASDGVNGIPVWKIRIRLACQLPNAVLAQRCEAWNLDYARSLPFAACVTVMECPPPILSPC